MKTVDWHIRRILPEPPSAWMLPLPITTLVWAFGSAFWRSSQTNPSPVPVTGGVVVHSDGVAGAGEQHRGAGRAALDVELRGLVEPQRVPVPRHPHRAIDHDLVDAGGEGLAVPVERPTTTAHPDASRRERARGVAGHRRPTRRQRGRRPREPALSLVPQCDQRNAVPLVDDTSADQEPGSGSEPGDGCGRAAVRGGRLGAHLVWPRRGDIIRARACCARSRRKR